MQHYSFNRITENNKKMLAVARNIDIFITKLGQLTAWLVFIMMLCVCFVVLLRSGFNQGFIALQESIHYLHACFFMLGIAFTLQQDEHVRVDVFYQALAPRKKHWINALGTIFFLMPCCVFILINSLNFVVTSWTMRETSAEPGGLPFVYLYKSLISLMALSLLIQGFALLIKNTYALMRINGHD